MKKSAIVAMMAVFAMTVSACATVKGVGKDIESVGQAGQDAID